MKPDLEAARSLIGTRRASVASRRASMTGIVIPAEVYMSAGVSAPVGPFAGPTSQSISPQVTRPSSQVQSPRNDSWLQQGIQSVIERSRRASTSIANILETHETQEKIGEDSQAQRERDYATHATGDSQTSTSISTRSTSAAATAQAGSTLKRLSVQAVR